MLFDNPPQPQPRPRKRRITLPLVTLRAVIVQLALEGALTPAEAEDMIAFYGLRNA